MKYQNKTKQKNRRTAMILREKINKRLKKKALMLYYDIQYYVDICSQ